MTIAPLEIGTQSNYGRYGQDGVARLINCYAEKLGKEGKAPVPVYACAGLVLFAELVDGGSVRAMIDVGDDLYVVAGRAIYRVDATGLVEQIGGMPSDGYVWMSRNRQSPNPQITVTCDGISKIIVGSTVIDLEDSDLPPASSNCNLAGYTVFSIADGRYFWTEIDESTDINALDFASAEANPDGLLVVRALGQHLVLFGARSTEFHMHTGSDRVFERSHVIQVGCFSAGSVAEVPIITGQAVTDSIAFAAADLKGAYAGVCIVENLSSRKISTHAVDRSIRDEPDRSSITAASWSDGGHAFYCISGSTFSWCWDSATGQWHERQSYGLQRWIGRSVQFFAGGQIVGDHTDNKLYRMSNDYHDEDGDPLIFTVQTPPAHAFPNVLEFNTLHIDVITGVGLVSGDPEDVDPQLMLSWSEDGQNFTSPRLLDLGRAGETTKRVKTTRLGQTKRGGGGRTYKVSVSARVARGLMAMAADVNVVAA